MKKVFVVVFACLFITGAVMATGNPPEETSRFSVLNKGSVVKVFYKTLRTNDVKIRILDKSNKEVYAETISSTDGFVRPYNFSNLPLGNYIIQVKEGDSTYEEKVCTLPSEERLFHVLPIKGSKGKYLLMSGKSPGKTVNVRIFDADSKVLYEKSFSSDRDFSEVLNTENVQGAVSIQVSDSSGAYKSYSFN